MLCVSSKGIWHSVHRLDLNARSQQQLETVFRKASGGRTNRAVCQAAQDSALLELSCGADGCMIAEISRNEALQGVV